MPGGDGGQAPPRDAQGRFRVPHSPNLEGFKAWLDAALGSLLLQLEFRGWQPCRQQ